MKTLTITFPSIGEAAEFIGMTDLNSWLFDHGAPEEYLEERLCDPVEETAKWDEMRDEWCELVIDCFLLDGALEAVFTDDGGIMAVVEALPRPLVREDFSSEWESNVDAMDRYMKAAKQQLQCLGENLTLDRVMAVTSYLNNRTFAI